MSKAALERMFLSLAEEVRPLISPSMCSVLAGSIPG